MVVMWPILLVCAAVPPTHTVLAPRAREPLADRALSAGAEGSRRSALEDVGTALRDLDATDPRRRARAERWLAVHLAVRDLPAVAAACRAGSAGTRATLERLLGGEDVLFGLAALLASDVDGAVASIGRAGLVGQVARWSPALLAVPLPEGDVPPDLGQSAQERERLALADRDARALAVRLDRGGFADLIDRLDRLAGAPAPIVLDPLLYAAVRRGPGEPPRPPRLGLGTWRELIEAECATQRLSLRVHGEAPYDMRRLADTRERAGGSSGANTGPGLDTEAEEALAFLREEVGDPAAQSATQIWIGLRGRSAETPFVERLAAWVTAVATEGGDPNLRAASARALASTRWPAAVLWLADHWLATGDAAALEGTLAAAARGLVAPRLVQPAVVRALLDEVDRRIRIEAQGSTPFAERVARALAAFPVVELDGAVDRPAPGLGPTTTELLVEGFSDLEPLAQWVRLVILEGRGRPHTRAAELVRGLLAPPFGRAVSARVAVQALAAWQAVSASGDLPPRVARPAALLQAAVESGLAVDAGRWLAASRARCDWTSAEVAALATRARQSAGQGGVSAPISAPTLALTAAEWAGLQHVAAVVGRGGSEVAWRPVIVRAMASAEGRATFAALARQARETGRLFERDPQHLVRFVRAALEVTTPLGADAPSDAALAFEAWVFDSGLGGGPDGSRPLGAEGPIGAVDTEATLLEAVRRALRGRDGRLDAPTLARLAGLVADPRSGAEARATLLRGLTLRIEAERAAEEAERARKTDGSRPEPDPRAAAELADRLPLEHVVECLARAAEVLADARLDAESETLFGELRSLAGRGWPDLAAFLYDPDWPLDGGAPGSGLDGAVPEAYLALDAWERLFGR